MSHSDWIKSLQHKSKDEILKDIAVVNHEAKATEHGAEKAGKVLSTDTETLIQEGEKIMKECNKAIQAAICNNKTYSDVFSEKNISIVSDAIAAAVKADTNIALPSKVCDMICAFIFKGGIDAYCKPYREANS